ncbi:MAG: ParA family protein [Lachnospiraceae bacterium]|nr:ParA family protein [Lachnospiraceae bacterium]
MGKIISITNQKGGVGKTATTVSLAACLAEYNMNVLIVDVDPQGNSTTSLGIDKDEQEASSYELFTGKAEVSECIVQTKFAGIDIIPSTLDLAGAEVEVVEFDDRNFILDKALSAIKDQYDFILIDCPPSLNTLTCNALTASDSVIIPLQCEFLALEGLKQLLDTIEIIRDRTNSRLQVDGVLFTMYDNRTNLSAQVVENVYHNLNQKIFRTVIPRAVRLAEAPSYGMPITFYDKRSSAAQSYRDFAVEVLRQNGKKLVKRKKLLRNK